MSKWIRLSALGLTFAAGVVVLMLWLAGAFQRKVPVGEAEPAISPRQVSASQPTVVVRTIRVPRTETAVGTVRAVHETALASKLLARVMEVKVKAGQKVQKDELLIRLDDADLTARLKQAQAAIESAKANRDRAKIEFERIEKLFQNNNSTKTEYDRADAALKGAQADLERAEQIANEATILQSYAVIRSPLTGVVVDKKVDVGDTVSPGTVLLTLYDPSKMQLVASVRESLAQRLKVGQPLGVKLDVMNYACEAQISEIVPEAQSASRSFQVKVTGPCPPGVYSGMFGRLYVPLDEEDVLVVPATAIYKVGQLDMVNVLQDGQVVRRIVQPGRDFKADREVLSGLKAGETVVGQGGE